MSGNSENLTQIFSREWNSLSQHVVGLKRPLEVDGKSLDLACIIAVSRHGIDIQIDRTAAQRLAVGAQRLEDDLRNGQIVYGVNTGVGGSANTRTQHVEQLQASLVSMLHCGIMYPVAGRQSAVRKATGYPLGLLYLLQEGLMVEDSVSTNCMPESWVRSAILIRINSLMRGVSSIRPIIVERLADLLRINLIPRVPVHGSISASGDLCPLSYIAGSIQGKRHITVLHGQDRLPTTADVAFAEADLKPVSLAAKEGLALVNGTAFSSGVGALVMHDVCGLCVLAQVLTAMSVEALRGTAESFHSFLAAVRSHPGQTESSQNIFGFLQNSQLAGNEEDLPEKALLQDRYSIRTASQWIGPVLEDCLTAYHQTMTECNSVTDNPLTDHLGNTFQGGNFQARVITSAMEKTRQGIQSLGRMLFTQCTELINPATNNGLAPNLTIDPPSQSFILKGVDVMCASFVSELGFLANPVGCHVQTAEMGNQALNSLALISARYTHGAADLLSKLCAAHLVVVCQALDLRAFEAAYLSALELPFRNMTFETWQKHTSIKELHPLLWSSLRTSLNDSTAQDPTTRFTSVASSLQLLVLSHMNADYALPLLASLTDWTQHLATLLQETYDSTRTAYLEKGNASHLLGDGTRPMYLFVRQTLEVPLLHESLLHAQCPERHGNDDQTECAASHLTIGDYIARLHKAIRQGLTNVPAMDAIKNIGNRPRHNDGD